MKFGLREKKFAQTKLAILEVFVKHLESGKHMDELSNKEICNRVEISEATFYNYFPQRKHILQYMFKLWEIEIVWAVLKDNPGLKGIKFIEELAKAKRACKLHDVKVSSEILSVVAREGLDKNIPELTDAEVYLAFPDNEGVLDIPRNKNYEGIYSEHLNYAMEHGEIKKDIDIEAVTYALMGVGMGAIIFLKDEDDANERVDRVATWHANLILDALKI